MFEKKYLGFNDLLKLAKQKAKASERWAKILQDLEKINNDAEDKKEFNKHLKKYEMLNNNDLERYFEE